MSGELTQLNVKFKVLKSTLDGWKSLQELGHSPSDLGASQSSVARQINDNGYAGPQYESQFRYDLSATLGDVQIGRTLSINNTPGAPADSFVYGAGIKDENYTVNEKNLIMCTISPSKESFTNIESFTESELSSTVASSSLRSYLGGISAGRAQASVYIPENSAAVPGNLNNNDWLVNKNYWFKTNNIWNIKDLYTNTLGVITGKYIRGVGPYANNSLIGGAYLKQQGGGRVEFNCQNTRTRIFRCADDNGYSVSTKPLNLAGKWVITADYGAYKYLYPNASIFNDPSSNNIYSSSRYYDRNRPVAIGNSDNPVFDVKDSMNPDKSTGFIINLIFAAKQTLDVYRDGYPTVEIVIGNPNDTISMSSGNYNNSNYTFNSDNKVIKWAKVTLASNRPPLIMFPAIVTTGSRYLKIGPQDSYSTTQFIAGQKVIKADASDAKCKISYELFGDVGHVDVSVEGQQSLNAVIAPQMAVYTGKYGQTINNNSVLDCWCGIEGLADFTVTNCNGSFMYSPNCYLSWDPNALMFKHQEFDMSWSSVLDSSDINQYSNISSGAYARPEYRSGFDPNLKSYNNSQSVDRYPDTIKDSRYNQEKSSSIIYFMNMNREIIKSSQQSSSRTWNSSLTKTDGNDASFIDIGDGVNSSSFIKSHSVSAIEDRGIYSVPVYGSNIDHMANYSIPTCAVWAHLFCNEQLVTVWPRFDHKKWTQIAQNRNFNNFYRNIFVDFLNNNSRKVLESNLDNEIASFNIRSQLDGLIIKNTAEISIINPTKSAMDNIFQVVDIMNSSRIWIELTSRDQSGNTINFKGIVRKNTYKSIGAGIQMDIVAQDPFSFMMETLQYPQTHRVDGWPINIAIPYILLRTGIPLSNKLTNDSTYLYNNIVQRIGRFIMSDYKSASIQFNQGSLSSNLSKAVGPMLLNSFPVFYYDHLNNKIEYKNIIDSADIKNSTWDRIINNTAYSIGSMPSSYSNKNYVPYQRGSFQLTVENDNAYNQIIFQSKDRFRNSPIVSTIDPYITGIKSGYKNSSVHNFDGIITSSDEIKLLPDSIRLMQPESTPMSVSFTILGSPNNEIMKNGGCAVIENKPIPNVAGYANRRWLLSNTSVNWKADSNQVTTTANYEILTPPLFTIKGNSIISN